MKTNVGVSILNGNRSYKTYYINICNGTNCDSFFLVQSQPNNSVTSLENELKANLTRMVKFIVHPSAQPSKELINYALASGGTPRTDIERLVYLGLLKKIARSTPDLVRQFTENKTGPDGKQTQSLDEVGIDVYITTNALQYVQEEHKAQAFVGIPVMDIVNSVSSNSTATNTSI